MIDDLDELQGNVEDYILFRVNKVPGIWLIKLQHAFAELRASRKMLEKLKINQGTTRAFFIVQAEFAPGKWGEYWHDGFAPYRFDDSIAARQHLDDAKKATNSDKFRIAEVTETRTERVVE